MCVALQARSPLAAAGRQGRVPVAVGAWECCCADKTAVACTLRQMLQRVSSEEGARAAAALGDAPAAGPAARGGAPQLGALGSFLLARRAHAAAPRSPAAPRPQRVCWQRTERREQSFWPGGRVAGGCSVARKESAL